MDITNQKYISTASEMEKGIFMETLILIIKKEERTKEIYFINR
jgi:hypothetical protein